MCRQPFPADPGICASPRSVLARLLHDQPIGARVTQQARNLGLDFADLGIRFLIRDGDGTCSGL